jgi:hypothetical protein
MLKKLTAAVALGGSLALSGVAVAPMATGESPDTPTAPVAIGNWPDPMSQPADTDKPSKKG